jgi:1-acyl-sn-glycerol-3-phosphate acyltransferase
MFPWPATREMCERVERLELPWNPHGYDPYGISKRELAKMFTALALLYRHWFTVSVHGIDHVPPRGRAMLVGNHSGGVAFDAMTVLASVFLEMEPPRLAQGMAEKFLNRLPFASLGTSRTGNFTGLPENAVRLLEDERLLMVFPEGARGTEKLYRQRHSLVQFGTGFLRLALQTRTPVVPFAFVGGGEAFPTVANLYRLGKMLGVPYLPVTAYLLPVPLPVHVQVLYGEPLEFPGTGGEEDEVIAGWVGEVKDRIAALIDRGAHGEARP